MLNKRFSFILMAAVSWAAVISAPFSAEDNDGDSSKTPGSTFESINAPCTGECNPPIISSESSTIELRIPHSPYSYSHHSKYDSPEPPKSPHIPTTWKVAIGVNAFVLLITASILGMLVWILRTEYKKRKLMGEAYVGNKNGFGRRMKSARRARGRGSTGGGRDRAWSYDPIREEEEEGEVGMGMVLNGLNGGEGGLMQAQGMRDGILRDGLSRNGIGKGKEVKMGKAKRAWGERHVRFENWNGDSTDNPKDKLGVVTGSSGKEERILELRVADGPIDVQTP